MELLENTSQRLLNFQKEVLEGLTALPKYLSSKYIYDKKGDLLFQKIMALPEYYLTNCEWEILSTHKEAISELFRDRALGLDLIELGAGDGKKTKVLLKHMLEKNINFIYKPVDISEHALHSLKENLAQEIPKLEVKGAVGEYFEVLDRLKALNRRKKVIMVLGSNIGNLPHPDAILFLQKLQETLGPEDLIFMGMDQKKKPLTIQKAYNDASGVTAAFNKNLLERINNELGGNFDTDKFTHWETYNPETGTAKSYLIATEAMQVRIEAIDTTIEFRQWETIHTEISQKYDDKTVEWMATKAKLDIVTSFSDKKAYFKTYIFRKKGN